MTEFCFICHCPATISDIQTHFCTESATISGKSILNIANDILALSDIDVTSITCQLCYEIVDEIDAFDHSLAQAKQKLQDRYEPKLRQDTNDKKCVSFRYKYYFLQFTKYILYFIRIISNFKSHKNLIQLIREVRIIELVSKL